MSATNTPAKIQGGASPQRLDSTLLNLLVCPVTRGPLTLDQKTQRLISKQAGLAFPIIDGVPILLVEEAEELDDQS